MTQKENNVGSVVLAGTLLAGEAGAIKLSGRPKSGSGSGAGLLKVIRPDSWQTRVTIAGGSFTA